MAGNNTPKSGNNTNNDTPKGKTPEQEVNVTPDAPQNALPEDELLKVTDQEDDDDDLLLGLEGDEFSASSVLNAITNMEGVGKLLKKALEKIKALRKALRLRNEDNRSLSQKIKDLETAAANAASAHATELLNLKNQHKLAHDEKIRIIGELKDEIAEMIDDHDTAIKNLNTAHGEEVKRLTTQYDSLNESTKETMQKQLESLNAATSRAGRLEGLLAKSEGEKKQIVTQANSLGSQLEAERRATKKLKAENRRLSNAAEQLLDSEDEAESTAFTPLTVSEIRADDDPVDSEK